MNALLALAKLPQRKHLLTMNAPLALKTFTATTIASPCQLSLQL